MPKRKSIKPSNDPNVRAFRVVEAATEQEPETQPEADQPRKKNPHAVRLGQLGGKKGGKRRLETMTAEQRSEAARRAAQARWKKRKDSDTSRK